MLRLQSLRIPPGWEMVINKFLEVDITKLSADDKLWYDLTEDILHVRRRGKKLLVGIDLGWYPDTDPFGEFVVKVILNDNWETPIEEYRNREQTAIVEKIEELLIKYCSDFNVRKQAEKQSL